VIAPGAAFVVPTPTKEAGAAVVEHLTAEAL